MTPAENANDPAGNAGNAHEAAQNGEIAHDAAETAGNASDATAYAENARDVPQDAGNETASQAPAGDLPEAAPGFVGELLEEINSGVTGLGESISEIASSANPAEVTAVAVDVAAAIPL